jgi:hypothetical protein
VLQLCVYYFSWRNLALGAFVWWTVSVAGICFCYHRQLTHRSFKTHKWLVSAGLQAEGPGKEALRPCRLGRQRSLSLYQCPLVPTFYAAPSLCCAINDALQEYCAAFVGVHAAQGGPIEW